MGIRGQDTGSWMQLPWQLEVLQGEQRRRGKNGGGAHLDGRRRPLTCTLAAIVLPVAVGFSVAVVAIVGWLTCRRRGSPTLRDGPLHALCVSIRVLGKRGAAYQDPVAGWCAWGIRGAGNGAGG